MDDLRLLWAKSGAVYPTDYHPVLDHLLDVGQVCLALWDVLREPVRRQLSDAIGLPPDQAARWVAFWVGAHDLGKVSPCFQAKKPEARAALQAIGFDFEHLGDVPHGNCPPLTWRTCWPCQQVGHPFPKLWRAELQ